MKPVNDEVVQEQRLQELGLTAPRVTPEMLDSMIHSTTFTLLPCKTMMVCQIKLNNGFKILGKNSTVDPDNFKLALAEEYSYKDARAQMWPYAGFLLAEDLHRGNNPLTEEQRKLPGHVQRVITEMYQVSGKLMGLTEFLNAYDADPAPYADIGTEEIDDLIDQQVHMTRYVKVLQRRLERAGV